MASQYRRRSLMLNTIAKVAQGNPTIITDSSSRRLQKLNIYGQSEQDGTPSVENPIPIISKEVNEIRFNGKNLFDIENVEYYNKAYGLTMSRDGEYVKVEGTSTQTLPSASFSILMYNDTTLSGKGYFVFAKEVSGIEIASIYGFRNESEKSIAVFMNLQEGKRYSGKFKIMVTNQNEQDIPYEPYKEQVVNLTSPITLRGIPVPSGGNVTIDGQQYIADYIDSLTGKVNRLNGYIDSYNGEEVGTIFMSTTGQLTTGAKVIYKLSQPTQEDLPQQDQEAIRALTTYYPNTVIQTGCWNEVTYSAKRGG